VLSDFGMSRLLLPSTDHGAEVYTMTHDAVVPIRWMAPECLRDRQFTAASDVWALGVTMYQCVTRCSLPYGDSQNALQIAIGVVTGSLVLHIDESIPPLIADWIKLCLKPEPAARPSCTQLLAMLDVMMKQLQCP
jgi:serine/threonine protein kinase